MAGSPSSDSSLARSRALIIGFTVIPVLLAIGVLFLLGANTATPAPSPTPTPSGGTGTPQGPAVGVIEAACRTLPIDAQYAFEAVPLPPNSIFAGDVPATELATGLVAKRYNLVWPDGGFAGWFGSNLGSWSLSGGKTTTLGSGLRAAELVFESEEIVGSTVIVESGGLGADEQAVVRVEMDSVRAENFFNAPLIDPDRAAVSIGRDGQGDGCYDLSAYFYDSNTGKLIDDLSSATLGSLFRAEPFDASKSVIANDATPAHRPVRLPDGGWRLPVEGNTQYTFSFARTEGNSTELVNLYENCGVQQIVSPIVYSSGDPDLATRPRYILRLDLAQLSATDGSSCRDGLRATLEPAGVITAQATAAGAAPQLNGLAVGIRYGQWLQYRPELIARLQAAEVATEQAGAIGTLIFYGGIGGGIGMAVFAYYLFRVMDRRRRPVRSGKGLARPGVKGRR